MQLMKWQVYGEFLNLMKMVGLFRILAQRRGAYERGGLVKREGAKWNSYGIQGDLRENVLLSSHLSAVCELIVPIKLTC